ncbi:MAG: Zn-ribbon domain-containing OB-fold protein [Deltaproteobacteria bacterium]|nr:Zn-ribbon domain-containing OB-fold protein [Deltaproteobacteria bacterium]
MQIAKSWRRQPSNLRLEGTRCTACGHLAFPATIRCRQCGQAEFDVYQFTGFGEVVVSSIVYEAPRDFGEHVPYCAAVVRLEEGISIATMITDVDPEDVSPGMPVEMVTRRIAAQGDKGPILYAYKFAPLLENQ